METVPHYNLHQLFPAVTSIIMFNFNAGPPIAGVVQHRIVMRELQSETYRSYSFYITERCIICIDYVEII